MDSDQLPDYSGETDDEQPTQDAIQRLNGMIVRMAQLTVEKEEIEEKLKETERQLREYQDNLIPELMSEIGLNELTTRAGIRVEMKEVVIASFPKDEVKRNAAFEWLEQTGNDGLVKREVRLLFGRESTEAAEQTVARLNEWFEQMDIPVEMREDWAIHHQTLLKFLRDQLDEGTDIPLEAFGAFVQKRARIKRGK